MQEMLGKFERMLEKELEKELEKIDKSGAISPDEIRTLKDAFKLMKLIKEHNGDSSYESGYSSRRGRSRTTGRYMSRDDGSFGSYESNGSYHGSPMVEKLERMLGEARNEHERRMIEEWIDQDERM